MAKAETTPAHIAARVRRVLKDGGSGRHAAEVEWFFKGQVRSRGWYTGDLRKAAVRMRRSILKEGGLAFLLEVADKLFSGHLLEEKAFAVFLLETLPDQFGDREFHQFTSWLSRISSWADHDALVHYLISPMVVAKPQRAKKVFRWVKSPDLWHRRAACVALIRGARRKMFFPDIKRLSELLLTDEDDMVQKGLGWLLREAAKYNPDRTVPYLMNIRKRAPRLVLRTACETLPPATRKRILS